MTAQLPEVLIHEGKEQAICSVPLYEYFQIIRRKPHFKSNCTALWRGYIGTWEITERRLYLIQLQGRLDDDSTVCLATLFPGFPNRVFAHWYTGSLIVPQGKLLKYHHGGFGSVYERDLMIKVTKGVIIEYSTKENGTSDDPGAPEGYGVAAFTVFGNR